MKTTYAALICGSLITFGVFGIAIPPMVHNATLVQCAELARQRSTSATAQWCADSGYMRQVRAIRAFPQ